MKNELPIEISPVSFDNNEVTIKLSKGLAKYLGINKKTKNIFTIPTNKILQISVAKPLTYIPCLTEKNFEFEKQDYDN